MKKISSFISLLCILNILAILGLFGYLVGTGRLDKSKAQTITDILRAPVTPANFRTGVYDLMNPESTTQSATTTMATATASDLLKGDIPPTAVERNEYVRKAIEAERLRHESQAQQLQNTQVMLDQLRAELAASAEKLEARKKLFDEQLANVGKQKDDAAFKRTLAVFDELKPQQIKDLMLKMTPDEIVPYLTAMDAERAAKIISTFKSEKEKEVISAVMTLMASTPSAPGTGAASGSPAALSASAAPPVKAGP